MLSLCVQNGTLYTMHECVFALCNVYAYKYVRCFIANTIALLLHSWWSYFCCPVDPQRTSTEEEKNTKEKKDFLIYNYCIPFYVRCVFICVHMRSLPNEKIISSCVHTANEIVIKRANGRANQRPFSFLVCVRVPVCVRARAIRLKSDTISLWMDSLFVRWALIFRFKHCYFLEF